jgi:uncharacterized protein DUF4440
MNTVPRITFRRALSLVAFTSLLACWPDAGASLTPAERQAIASAIEQRVKTAYDLGAEDVLAGMLSLYPREGPVYSASGGTVTTTRDSLETAVRQFWNYVGRNMRDPKWEWTTMRVDVLSPTAAVMTATYRVPHLTPAGQPHVIGGAWTAVFAKRAGEWVIVHEHLSDSPAP